jgi:hypothetical protein
MENTRKPQLINGKGCKIILPGSGEKGCLYIQGQKDEQGLSRPGMVGGHVLSHSEQGRADGSVTWISKPQFKW